MKKEVPQETFFDFFSPPQPIAEEDMDEEFDEDLRQHLEERIELDFEIGEALKEKIIPRAIDWYTGKALQYDDFQDDVFYFILFYFILFIYVFFSLNFLNNINQLSMMKKN